jgi:hypothetical protein
MSLHLGLNGNGTEPASPRVTSPLGSNDAENTEGEGWLEDGQLLVCQAQRPPAPSVTNERHCAANRLAQSSRTVRLLWVALIVSLTAHLIVPAYLVSVLRRPEKVALMDGTQSLIIAPLVSVEESREILETVFYWAAKSFLDRSPQGFDASDTLERVFLPAALEKAKEDFKSVAEEFTKKNIHQKLEIGRIDLQRIDSTTVLSHVVGQLLSQAEIDGEQVNQPQPVSLNLKLVRNPYLGRNQRYPFAVTEYTFGRPETLQVQTTDKK